MIIDIAIVLYFKVRGARIGPHHFFDAHVHLIRIVRHTVLYHRVRAHARIGASFLNFSIKHSPSIRSFAYMRIGILSFADTRSCSANCTRPRVEKSLGLKHVTNWLRHVMYGMVPGSRPNFFHARANEGNPLTRPSCTYLPTQARE